LGQCWVTLALTLSKGFRSLGIPLLSRLARQGGNSGKLVAAQALLRVVAPLFQVTELTHKRGRSRKHGDRATAYWVASLPEVRQQFAIYGKTQTVYYRSAIVLARFLKGRPVRMVWGQFEKEDGTRTQTSLILSTDISLSGARVISDTGDGGLLRICSISSRTAGDGKKPGVTVTVHITRRVLEKCWRYSECFITLLNLGKTKERQP